MDVNRFVVPHTSLTGSSGQQSDDSGFGVVREISCWEVSKLHKWECFSHSMPLYME